MTGAHDRARHGAGRVLLGDGLGGRGSMAELRGHGRNAASSTAENCCSISGGPQESAAPAGAAASARRRLSSTSSSREKAGAAPKRRAASTSCRDAAGSPARRARNHFFSSATCASGEGSGFVARLPACSMGSACLSPEEGLTFSRNERAAAPHHRLEAANPRAAPSAGPSASAPRRPRMAGGPRRGRAPRACLAAQAEDRAARVPAGIGSAGPPAGTSMRAPANLREADGHLDHQAALRAGTAGILDFHEHVQVAARALRARSPSPKAVRCRWPASTGCAARPRARARRAAALLQDP
jgi:hypothetical protein